MKMRQPNKRRFKSSIRERQKRQREYYYASVSVLVVKIILLVFLIILFSVSLRLFHYRFPHLTPVARYAVPLLVALFALTLAYFIYKNIKDMRDIQREKRKT